MATQRTPNQRKQKPETPEQELLRLYQPFRFLEAEHWGEYLVVAKDGRYVTSPDEVAAVEEALAQFGPGLTILKVGEIAAGRLPWLKQL
jgi:hypothetical protein